MSLIRRGQRAVTNINPHNSNRRYLVSNRPRPAATTVVPDIVGLTAANANIAIAGASMITGAVTGDIDPVISQGILAGTVVPVGTALGYGLTVSTIVPNIVGLTAAAADAAILGANMVVGTVTGTIDPVLTQGTPAATVVPTGTALDYALTA